ncbi:MAG: electron transport complex subunit RsxC [Gallionellaceae bacterium]|nr:electron transport complex subunit RsxC [Gallionellaceae bacterium]
MLATLFRFKGGVKPASHKDESTYAPITAAPLPTRLVVPLRQSTGGAPLPLVQAGQSVLKGERIGAPEGNFSSAIHAPTSGKVLAVEPRMLPHPSGLAAPCVVIEPDGAERWIDCAPANYASETPDTLRDILRDAGIVGLGGATFPSHLKLKPGVTGRIETLIINGAECEPWITCDDLLMRERAAEITRGIAILRHIVSAERVLVGIEDNKLQAVAAMRAATAQSDGIEVVQVPTRYPAGGERQLIRVLTGIEIPYGRFGTDFGVQCFNVATAYSVHRAIDLGQPLISRIVTLTGNVERPGNVEVLIGTPIDELLKLAAPKADTNRYIMGGPMMGFTLPRTDLPVTKAANCILAASPALFPPQGPEMPCIRCGACTLACPAELQPHELYWFSRAKNFGKAQEYGIFDCIECGCCAYVCPSNIRLVDYYRFAKSSMRTLEREKAVADAARERFEFRNQREEREKAEKAARLAAKTAAARQAAADTGKPAAPLAITPASTTVEASSIPLDAQKKALIAAAIARVQAQKAGVQPRNTDNLTPEKQAEIREIEARRNKVRELAKTPPEEPV